MTVKVPCTGLKSPKFPFQNTKYVVSGEKLEWVYSLLTPKNNRLKVRGKRSRKGGKEVKEIFGGRC